MTERKDYFKHYEIEAWIEQESSIHLFSADKNGNPVELNATEARKLVDALLGFIKKLEEDYA